MHYWGLNKTSSHMVGGLGGHRSTPSDRGVESIGSDQGYTLCSYNYPITTPPPPPPPPWWGGGGQTGVLNSAGGRYKGQEELMN